MQQKIFENHVEKKMVFEDYFEKFKGIKSLTACFGYSTI